MVVSSPPTVLDFCGGCAVPCLLSLALRWVRFCPAVSTAPVRCEVCSLDCPSWLVLLSCLCCPSPALAVGFFGPRSVAPPASPVCWALVGSLLRRSVTLAYGHTLSFSCFSLGVFLWRLFGHGLVGCGPAWVPAFFWGGTLLPLSWLFLLDDSYSVVVQAP